MVKDKKIAIGTWAYIWGGYADKPIPLDTVLPRLQELGFDGIQFTGFPPHLPREQYEDEAALRAVKDLADRHHLEICAFVGDFNEVPPITSPDGAYEAFFRKVLHAGKRLGVRKTRVDTIHPPLALPDGYTHEQAMEKLASRWRTCAAMAADEGQLMVWEFEPGFLFNKPSEIVELVQRVGHSNFKVQYDSCHAHMCAAVGARQMGERETLPGGAVELAERLTGQIGDVHLIDSDGTLHDDHTSTHVPFGRGQLDFAQVVAAIKRAGYNDVWWTIDLCFWPNAMEATAPAKRAMDEIIARYA